MFWGKKWKSDRIENPIGYNPTFDSPLLQSLDYKTPIEYA
jgi:hypothetical protein